MNILITSGSIVETIDKVYYIGQNSDTSIAAIIGEEFSKNMNVDNIFYLYGGKSRFPWESSSSNDQKFFFEEWEEKVHLHPINGLPHLKETIESICSTHKVDVVIHLMSIANYGHTVVHLLKDKEDALEFVRKLGKKFQFKAEISDDVIRESISPKESNKLSTHGKMKTGYKQVILEQHPQEKILTLLKEKNKNAIFISGKFEFGVKEDDLLKLAWESLVNNKSDYVIASDLIAHKSGDEEGYFLVNQNSPTSKRLDDSDLAAQLISLFEI